MSEVPRFTQWCALTHGHGMNNHERGEWVRFVDHERAIAAAQREGVREFLEKEPSGEWRIKYQRAQRPHPMFRGDFGSPELWAVEGPGEMAQLFTDEHTARAVANALNALAGEGTP